MRDTLVTADINIGTNVAYNSQRGRTFKVVTLQGELIESTGVMSGGGKPKQGLMSNKLVQEFSQDQINQVSSQIEKMQSDLQE